jgi:hypothetical protein
MGQETPGSSARRGACQVAGRQLVRIDRYGAERFDELFELLRVDTIWPYKQWAVRALAASGKKAEALRYAESCRSPCASDHQIDSICEEILLSSGLLDEAYARYGVRANQAGTYLATYRAVSKKYPHKSPGEILADLVNSTPGDEGKWFAAAKDAGLPRRRPRKVQTIAAVDRQRCIGSSNDTRKPRSGTPGSPPCALLATQRSTTDWHLVSCAGRADLHDPGSASHRAAAAKDDLPSRGSLVAHPLYGVAR